MTRPHGKWTLCEADAAALDRLLGQVDQDTAATTADRARAQRVGEVLALLGRADVSAPPADLVQRTLARVETLGHAHPILDDNEARPTFGPGVRMAELLAVAATIVIGISLALPVLARMSGEARRVFCASNLDRAGVALAQYAADHHGVLPRLPVNPGDAWFIVGQTPNRHQSVQSNSANLYLLARQHYLAPGTLACPENPHAPTGMTAAMNDWPTYQAVSYSFQNQYSPTPLQLNDASAMAVLADKNPLFVVDDTQRLLYRSNLPQTAASSFHHHRGQNVLTGDGAVAWTTEPIVGGDNIWLATGVSRYTGVETPTSKGDAFLVP